MQIVAYTFNLEVDTVVRIKRNSIKISHIA